MQNNTLSVHVNPYEIARFAARLDYEHSVAASRPPPDFRTTSDGTASAGTGGVAGGAT